MPTMKDVAAKAGVSQMTVSRVINSDTRVSAPTRDRVQKAIETLHYVPSPSAQSLAGNKSLRILMLYTSASEAYLSGLLLGALEEAGGSGHQLLVNKFDHTQPEEEFSGYIKEQLKRSHAIILPSPLADKAFVRDLAAKHEWPIIFLSAYKRGQSTLQVCINEFKAAYDMTQHLLEKGHREIGFIKGPLDHYASSARYDGFIAALRDARIEHDKHRTATGDFTFQSGLTAAQTLLDTSPAPSAIFASNDDMAAAVLTIAAQRGVKVPEMLSVCGFDDTAIASCVHPRLTTVRQPLEDMAKTAIRRAISRLNLDKALDASPKNVAELTHEIVLGGSVAEPSGP